MESLDKRERDIFNAIDFFITDIQRKALVMQMAIYILFAINIFTIIYLVVNR